MKQVKFLLVALMAVVMGVSVTSCMKGEDNNIVQGSDLVRVNKLDFPISFTPRGGVKLIPTQAIMTADEDMAIIYYQFDKTTIAPGATSIAVTLLADPSYIKESYVVTSSMTADAPVITLEPATAYGVEKGLFFDKNTLVLPLAYKYKRYEKAEDAAAELKKHRFDLVYDAENSFANGILTLRLCHIAEPIMDGENKVERKDNVYEYRAFNLSNVLSGLASKPTSIKVVIDQNEKDDKFTDNIKDASFSYEYNFKE